MTAHSQISRDSKRKVLNRLRSLMEETSMQSSGLEPEELSVARKIASSDLNFLQLLNDDDVEATISIIHANWDLNDKDTNIAIDMLTQL